MKAASEADVLRQLEEEKHKKYLEERVDFFRRMGVYDIFVELQGVYPKSRLIVGEFLVLELGVEIERESIRGFSVKCKYKDESGAICSFFVPERLEEQIVGTMWFLGFEKRKKVKNSDAGLHIRGRDDLIVGKDGDIDELIARAIAFPCFKHDDGWGSRRYPW